MAKNILEMHVPSSREIYTAPQSGTALFFFFFFFFYQLPNLTTHQDMYAYAP